MDVLWLRSVTIFAVARLVGLGSIGATALQALSAVLVIGLVIYTWRNQKAPELRAAILGFGTLLVTPRAMIYDLPYLLVPILFVLGRLPYATLKLPDWIFLGLLWLGPIAGFFLFEEMKFQVWPILMWVAMSYCMMRYSAPRRPRRSEPDELR